MTLDFPPNATDPNPPEAGDLFPPTGTPLWEFTGNGWKRLGGGGTPPDTFTAQQLGVESNSARLRGPGNTWTWGGVTTTGRTQGVYLLTINSTAAFTLDISSLPTGLNWWEATVIITTTQVPTSFTFTGVVFARVGFIEGFGQRPLIANTVSVLRLTKLADNFISVVVQEAAEPEGGGGGPF